MTTPLPGPLDEAPTVTAQEADEHLTASLDGLLTGAWDVEFVDKWARVKDPVTVESLANLFDRVHARAFALGVAAGKTAAEKDSAELHRSEAIRTLKLQQRLNAIAGAAAVTRTVGDTEEALHALLDAINAATS